MRSEIAKSIPQYLIVKVEDQFISTFIYQLKKQQLFIYLKNVFLKHYNEIEEELRDDFENFREELDDKNFFSYFSIRDLLDQIRGIRKSVKTQENSYSHNEDNWQGERLSINELI